MATRTLFSNHERGLWQVGLLVRALRSVQEISYFDLQGHMHKFGFKIDARDPFMEIANPLIGAIYALRDAMNADGSLPETVMSLEHVPFVKIVLFLAEHGPLGEEGKGLTFEDFCRDVR